MEDWGQFFWSVVASSAGTTALLAAAGWLCKGQISHWLNRDLEAAKAQHQRDLEAYKITLIAAAERAKAAQEIRRASALKMLEMKVDALKRLHSAHRGLGTELLAFASMPASFKTPERCTAIEARVEEFAEATVGIELFIEPGEHRVFLNFRGQMLRVAPLCAVNVAPPSDDAHRALSDLLQEHEIAADRMIRQLFANLESLD